ncbi:MAG: 3-hydroxyacyl-CoA dehydrogenase NAD-binding domain-containing protein [Polyangiaceae bacterium]
MADVDMQCLAETNGAPEAVGPALRLDADTMEVVLGPGFEVLDGAHAGELASRVSLAEQAGVRGLVFRFCGGEASRLLDADRLDGFETPGQAEAALEEATRLVSRIERSPLLCIAVIERDLGGPNLELALACRHLIAGSGLRLGLDAASLGVVPALGGALRLAERLGAHGALAHLLRGELADSEVACEIGLVDECLARDALVSAARQWVSRPLVGRLGALRDWARVRLPSRVSAAEIDSRSDVARALRSQLRGALWRDAGRQRAAAAQAFSRLVCGEQSAALRRLARMLDERAPRGGSAPRVALVGGGRVGAELAQRTLLAGGVLRLLERDEKALLRGSRRVRDGLRKSGLDGVRLERAMGHMTHTAELSRLGSFDVVIEAIAEESVVKRRLLDQVAVQLARSTDVTKTLVTTSSTHELSRLASGQVTKVALVGLHLGLVDERPYAELVHGDPAATHQIGALLSSLGYRVVTVSDVAPGLCLRLVTAFIVEGLELGREGFALSDVDQAARNWGFELGPSELLSRLGRRTFSDLVAVAFHRSPRRFPAPARLEAVFEAQPKPRRWSRPASPVPVERLVLRLVEEARSALQDGVVARPELADLAAVWGMGFPAYRGGPLRFAETLGERKVQRRLSRLAALHGPRFEPSVVL